jgi:hypothetical protein
MKRPSLTAQIQEVEYELGMRKNVYPRLVRSQKLRQSEADYHTQRLEEVLATLQWLQQHEAVVKAAVGIERGRNRA